MEEEPKAENRVPLSEIPQMLLDNIEELKRESDATFYMIIRYRLSGYKNKDKVVFININDIKEILPDDKDVFSLRYEDHGKDTILKFENGPFVVFFSRKNIFPPSEDEMLTETPIYIRLYKEAYVLF